MTDIATFQTPRYPVSMSEPTNVVSMDSTREGGYPGTVATTASATLASLVSKSQRGMLRYCGICNLSGSTILDVQLAITINGTIVYDVTQSLNHTLGFMGVGAFHQFATGGETSYSLELIPYKTLDIACKSNGTDDVTMMYALYDV